MKFYDRVNTGMTMRGMRVSTLARALKLSTQSIYNWKDWECCKLSAENLINLSNVLGLSANWLFDGSGSPVNNVYNVETKEIIDIYEHLTPPNKQAFIATGRALLNTQPVSVANPFPSPKENQ